MIKVKGLFAVSLIAILMAGGVAVNSAVAAIASKGYVDQQIDTRQVAGDYATDDALGTVRETATNAQSAAAAAKTAADEAQDAADAAASAAATAQQTADAKVTANAAITAGTATKITYDAKGLVTGGASLTASDIPTIPSTKVSGLSTVATSGSYNDLDDKPSIPSAYVLKAATDEALGGVKSGGDITVATSGTVTVSHAANADSATSADHADTATTATSADHADTATSATKASQDASGRVITTTYATKWEITGLESSSTGDGAVVTGVSQSAGKVSVTKGNVKIPVGGENATSYATIWIE